MPDLVRMTKFELCGAAYSVLKRALADVDEARAAMARAEGALAESLVGELHARQDDLRGYMASLMTEAASGGDPVLLRPLAIEGRRIIKRFLDPIYLNGPRSEGLVFNATLGDPVLAPVSGLVVESGELKQGGYWGSRISIHTDDGRLAVWLCHLDIADVAIGDVVKAGEVIGRAGASGNAKMPQVLMVCQALVEWPGAITLPGLPPDFKVVNPWPLLFEKHPSDAYYLQEPAVEA